MKLLTIHSRCIILCLLSVTVTSLLTCRLVKIHILDSEKNQKEAQSSYLEREYIKARRGIIIDARNNQLVSNIFNASLIADRYRLDDPRMAALGLAYSQAANSPEWPELDEKGRNKLIERLRRKIYLSAQKDEEVISPDRMAMVEDLLQEADSSNDNKATSNVIEENFDKDALDKIIKSHEEYAITIIATRLNLNKDELLKKLRDTKNKRIVLVQNLTNDQVEILENDLRNMRVQGFTFDRSARRWYNMPHTLVHVLGYTDFRGRGMMGIEKSLDRYLAGQDGFRQSARDSRGLPLSSSLDKLKPAVHGLNLQLTIDMNIQNIVEEELDAGIAEFNPERIAAIMVEPKTGSIMAMACRPSYNLNDKDKEALEKGALNYCVQGVYEPGSTFKVVAVSGALDAKKVTLNTPINCGSKHYSEGAIQITDTSSYGTQPVLGVVRKSSNIGTYKIALRLSRDNFVQYLKNFGLGQKTGIDLSSESSGSVRDGKNAVDYSRMCIGYAVGVTPIQVAMVYAAIANGGVMMKPRLVERIFDNENKTVQEEMTKPQVLKRVISETAARDMRTALRSVTEQGGTGTRSRVPGFTVGGKTGTARRHVEGKGYMQGQYTVSFAGMLPAEKPAFICLVVVDNPRTTTVTHYGGTIAGPIFKKIAQRTAAALNLAPTEPINEQKAVTSNDHH